jgi:hypothetical protein
MHALHAARCAVDNCPCSTHGHAPAVPTDTKSLLREAVLVTYTVCTLVDDSDDSVNAASHMPAKRIL